MITYLLTDKHRIDKRNIQKYLGMIALETFLEAVGIAVWIWFSVN